MRSKCGRQGTEPVVPAAGPVPVAVAVPGYGDFALPPSAPAEAPRPVLQARGWDGGGVGGGGGGGGGGTRLWRTGGMDS